MTKTDIMPQLIDVIATVTGNDPEQISPESHLEEDLGIVLDQDFNRLLAKINAEFSIELNPGLASSQAETISDLATLVVEETELG
ncbi:MAG: phosphopantetheine-binding protein [Patescibacteria group bacterium]|nr:hypothetical protein [Patescibacteria group bacterium]